MNKLIAFSLAALSFWSCQKSSSSTVALSGSIKNPVSDSLVIRDYYNQTVTSIQVSPEGNFDYTGNIKSGLYDLFDGQNYINAYLENGMDFNISFDNNDFNNTLIFSGDGKAEGDYLKKRFSIQEDLRLESLITLNETEFKKNINLYVQRLDSLFTTHKGDFKDTFSSIETKALKYNEYTLLNIFKNTRNLREDSTISPQFNDYLKNIDLNDIQLYNNSLEYRNFIAQFILNKSNVNTSTDMFVISKDIVNIVNKEITNTDIKDDFLTQIGTANLLIPSNNKLKETYQLLVENVQSTTHKKQLETVFNAIQPIEIAGYTKGQTEISLSQYKGSIVYVDLWATWCGPCIQQIPFLKKLEEEYKGKNIKFVSISLDRIGQRGNTTWEDARNKWLKMLKKKKMSGIQLFAGEKFNPSIRQGLQINSIPRFILIGPDGNIINPNAPRPSSKEIRTLLDSYK